MGFKINLVSLKPIFIAASVLSAIKYCPQQRTHLHDVKLHEPVREKTNNLDSDQVRHKPGCTVTESG